AEEENFLQTLGTGIGFFERIVPYEERVAGLAEKADRNGAMKFNMDEPKSDLHNQHMLGKAYDAREQEQLVAAISSAATKRQVPGTGIGLFERIVPYVERVAGLGEKADRNGELKFIMDELKSDRQTMELLGKAYDARDQEQLVAAFSSAASKRQVPGQVAFLLHDTYGFPVDLTQLMAREVGLGVDMEAYQQLMQQQKDRARAASTFKMESAEGGEWQVLRDGEDSVFVGYDELDIDSARIVRMRTIALDDEQERHEIVLDRTPFYAESGGQVGDV